MNGRLGDAGHLIGQVVLHGLPIRGAWAQWTNNPRQDRYSRRVEHHHPRTRWQVPGELPPIPISNRCRWCGELAVLHLWREGLPVPRCRRWDPPKAAPRIWWQQEHLRPQVSTYSVRYPAVVGWLHGRARAAVCRWLDAHVRPWCTTDDLPDLDARPVYSVQAYLDRYRLEAAGYGYPKVTGGRYAREAAR